MPCPKDVAVVPGVASRWRGGRWVLVSALAAAGMSLSCSGATSEDTGMGEDVGPRGSVTVDGGLPAAKVGAGTGDDGVAGREHSSVANGSRPKPTPDAGVPTGGDTDVRHAAARPRQAQPSVGGEDGRERTGDDDRDPAKLVENEGAGTAASPAMMREVLGSVAARELPPGTDPEIAEVFRRIPVTVNDRGPVGGIARSGLHADRVSLGTQFSASRCRRPLERYSVSRGEDVSFCFRAVHRRLDEAVQVHWLKDGRLVRRSTLPIPPIHAYRTRARLALRREYVGSWRAVALSADGVELAQARFEVVE